MYQSPFCSSFQHCLWYPFTQIFTKIFLTATDNCMYGSHCMAIVHSYIEWTLKTYLRD